MLSKIAQRNASASRLHVNHYKYSQYFVGAVGTESAVSGQKYPNQSKAWLQSKLPKFTSSTSPGLVGFVMGCLIAAGAANLSSECEGKETTEKVVWKTISRKEVEKHNTLEKGVWVTHGNGVYDITNFIANHPGGKEKLMSVAGKDFAHMWNVYRHHKTSQLAQELLGEMKIGELPEEDVVVVTNDPSIAKYDNSSVYDVIIVGAGLSGLNTGSLLVNQYGVDKSKILVLEAQDYIGGRVKQMHEFMRGTKIEVGAEFLHGNNTELTKFARSHGEPLREIVCWAHGDGGPPLETADHGYGLYYVGANKQPVPGVTPVVLGAAGDTVNLPYKMTAAEAKLNSQDRLMRYDAKDPDFTHLNKVLWDLADMHEDKIDEDLSLYDYLVSKKCTPAMLKMGAAGFSNTLCSNSYELSLKQAVKWSRIWHNEGGEDEEDGDYTFKNSYSGLVDYLKKDLQVELNSPVAHIHYPSAVTKKFKADPKQAKPVSTDKTMMDHAMALLCPYSGKKASCDELIQITTKDGVQYKAKNVVLTSSPHVINNNMIAFTPELPQDIKDAYSYTKMNPVIKVIMKFSKRPWPEHLHGMIMVDDDFLLPEVWFRNVEDEVDADEPATAYAVGFTTSKYAEKVQGMTQEEVLKRCVGQLEKVFSKLEQKHMDGDNPDQSKQAPKDLPKASSTYLGGMFWDWVPEHHPYIGGGYASPLAGKPITIGDTLAKGYGKQFFFAGEATNDRPGATAHAALETGIRAAGQVAASLGKEQKKQ